jgi:hypothetical protein
VSLVLAFLVGTDSAHQFDGGDPSAMRSLHQPAIASKLDRNRTPGTDILQFKLDRNGAEPLPVDSALTWNTFLGAFTPYQSAAAIAQDGNGNVYVAGSSNVTWGLPIRSHSGCDDAFIAKLDSNGNLIWNTFIGGSGCDLAQALALDGSGNIYVVGWSTATWGSPIRAFSGGYDAFAAKVDPGGHLIWNTFLGGPGTSSGFDYGFALALDRSGNIYLAGLSGATWGSPVRAYSGDADAVVAKLDSSGNFIWNTFLGGAAEDIASGLAVDGNGNVYVTGESHSTWGLPVRAFTPSSNLNADAFVAKLDSSGNLIWNTFLGGNNTDQGEALAVDGKGNVCVAGFSYAAWGSPVRAYSDGNGAFVANLDSSGSLIWNTFLGGGAVALAVDAGGNIYVAGSSMATWGSPVRAFGGGSNDAFAAKLDSSGKLTWNTFLGGSGGDGCAGLAVDGLGNVYVAGTSDAAWGSPIRAFTGGNDAFVAKIPPPSNTIQFSSPSYTVNEGDGRVNITLTRGGDATSSASVSYATNDAAGLTPCNVFNGIASPRCDYESTIGTATWAAGDASARTFSVAIVDDSYVEGDETFTISLNSPSGATLGAQSTTVTIIDNDVTNGPNPIDNTNFFVRQQYIDFLGREPDPPGFAGWTSTINNCALGDTNCDRIHVSQLFFQSAEFQDRGYFVYRFYPVAFGRKPDYGEFVPDLASVSGFLDANQLEAAKVAFIAGFMARPAFVSAYNSLNNTQYVDMLLNNANAGISASARQGMIDGLNNLTLTRAQVLRQIVESTEVSTKYNHQAYAVMEYFGYLRRQPDAFYLDWIVVLDSTNDPRGMVTGFVTSQEYRNRFGP